MRAPLRACAVPTLCACGRVCGCMCDGVCMRLPFAWGGAFVKVCACACACHWHPPMRGQVSFSGCFPHGPCLACKFAAALRALRASAPPHARVCTVCSLASRARVAFVERATFPRETPVPTRTRRSSVHRTRVCVACTQAGPKTVRAAARVPRTAPYNPSQVSVKHPPPLLSHHRPPAHDTPLLSFSLLQQFRRTCTDRRRCCVVQGEPGSRPEPDHLVRCGGTRAHVGRWEVSSPLSPCAAVPCRPPPTVRRYRMMLDFYGMRLLDERTGAPTFSPEHP